MKTNMGDDWASVMAAVARELQEEPDETTTLERLTKSAVTVIDGCSSASVTLHGRHDTWWSASATDDAVAAADAAQYDLGEGPCLTSATEQRWVYAGDLATDERWPAWTPTAVELGFRSAFAMQLFVGERVYGALNLYSTEQHAFNHQTRDEADALAAHAAIALAAQREFDGLTLAVRNRLTIGQAQGILMERFDVDADHAFALLCRLSSTSNTKLNQIAQDVVHTRQLPPAAGPAA